MSEKLLPQTRVVRFDDLPRAVRERLLAIFTTPKEPRVLAFEVFTNVPFFKKLQVVLGAIGIFFTANFVLSRIREYGIGSDWITFGIFFVACTFLLSGLMAIAFEKKWPPAPFRRGRWALPGWIVETHGGWLELTPVAELGKPTILTVSRRGSGYQYSQLKLGGKLDFSFASKERVEEVCARVLAARDQVLANPEDDPFVECVRTGVWTVPNNGLLDGPMVAAAPRNAALFRWAIPAVISAALAIAFYVYANVMPHPQP